MMAVIEGNGKRMQDVYDAMIEYFNEAFGVNKYGVVAGLVSAFRVMFSKRKVQKKVYTVYTISKYRWNFINYERVVKLIHFVKVDVEL